MDTFVNYIFVLLVHLYIANVKYFVYICEFNFIHLYKLKQEAKMTEKERIEKVIQSEDMSSGQFASEIGIKNSTLSHILNNRNNPSLDVLKKILARFPQISSDWLILGSGLMYRSEIKSQSPSLFDFEDINTSFSDSYEAKNAIENSSSKSPKENEMLKSNLHSKNQEVVSPIKDVFELGLQTSHPPVKEIQSLPSRKVNKIILYYNDGTFQEFESK